MNLYFDGWYNQEGKPVRKDDISSKGFVTLTQRLNAFITDFKPVSGVFDDGLPYRFEAIRTFVYLNDDGTEVQSMEYVAWHKGNEISNIEIPSDLLSSRKEEVKKHPVPLFKK